MTTPNKRIIRINGSLLRQSACRLRTHLMGTVGYTGKVNSVQIEYGQAFHKYTQALALTNGDNFKAMAAAHQHFKNTKMEVDKKKEWMNIGHLTTTCQDFHEKVWENKERDFEIVRSYSGLPLVENKFSIPYYSDDEVEVLLEGTIDLKVQIFNGCFAIGDYKTTGEWNIPKFFFPFKLSNQLMLYRWAVEWHAKHYPQSIYAKMCEKRLGAFIWGIFLKSNQPTEFIRSEFYFYPEQLMKEFEDGLHTKVMQIVEDVKRGIYPPKEGMINGACKTEWGTCPFLSACSSPDSKSFEAILDINFEKKEYNPLSEK